MTVEEMDNFFENLKNTEATLEEIASAVISDAQKNGADESEVSIDSGTGISVSCRDADVENIEFNKDKSLHITVYKDKRSGSASTNDLSKESLHETVLSALNIATFADRDEFSGLCDKELICNEFKELELIFDNGQNTELAINKALSLDKMILEKPDNRIKKSDGSSFSNSFVTSIIANSHGFSHANSQSIVSCALTLLGEADNKMQRGLGMSISRTIDNLYSSEKIFNEALEHTLQKLNARKLKTGTYNVIFSRSAVRSLWGHLFGAISGGHIYRKSSFLLDKLGKQVLSKNFTVIEDPFVKGGFASRNYDADAVAVNRSEIVSEGMLNEYLLSTYSARKLHMQTNGHASGTHNVFIKDLKNNLSLDEMLKSVGEGVVITGLMGQGVNIVNGNYSRGAEGYYFRNGIFEHAVDGITVAGNLAEMFMKMEAMAQDIDERYSLRTGSILIPDMSISGL